MEETIRWAVDALDSPMDRSLIADRLKEALQAAPSRGPDAVRKQFEDHFIAQGMVAGWFMRMSNGEYRATWIEHMWDGWSAAIAALPPATPPSDERADRHCPAATDDEDHPDCHTKRERELYFALMGLTSAVMTRRREWENWEQGGVIIAPIVRKALRLDASMQEDGK